MEELPMWNTHEIALIRVDSGCAESTIKSYPQVSDVSKRRIEAAAKKHGLHLQPLTLRADSAGVETGRR
jgi:hypothetical protein